jgi:hypothetical protein
MLKKVLLPILILSTSIMSFSQIGIKTNIQKTQSDKKVCIDSVFFDEIIKDLFDLDECTETLEIKKEEISDLNFINESYKQMIISQDSTIDLKNKRIAYGDSVSVKRDELVLSYEKEIKVHERQRKLGVGAIVLLLIVGLLK